VDIISHIECGEILSVRNTQAEPFPTVNKDLVSLAFNESIAITTDIGSYPSNSKLSVLFLSSVLVLLFDFFLVCNITVRNVLYVCYLLCCCFLRLARN